MSSSVHPLVSIVMPAFNCEAYIFEFLSSIFRQDVENIEVIVVNDGSIDKTAEIVAAFDPESGFSTVIIWVQPVPEILL